MTIKETLIGLLKLEGYDTITACELAQKCIDEVKGRPPGLYTYYTKSGRSITIERR